MLFKSFRGTNLLNIYNNLRWNFAEIMADLLQVMTLHYQIKGGKVTKSLQTDKIG